MTRVRMGLIRKKADWRHEDFLQYWRNTHGALAARAPNLREYWQNAVAERLDPPLDLPHGPWEFDGFSQLWFADGQQADQLLRSSEFAALLMADERHFLGLLHIVTAMQEVVVPVPEGFTRSTSLKYMSILRRREDIGEDDFRREWSTHSDLVRRIPGVTGYRQNFVTARERTKGQPCGHAELPIDGIGELWLESADALRAAFSSSAGQAAVAHARTFLAEVTAYRIVEHRVV